MRAEMTMPATVSAPLPTLSAETSTSSRPASVQDRSQKIMGDFQAIHQETFQ